MTLDAIFFSRVIPLNIKDKIQKKRKGTMSESGESLQWKIIEGLNQNLDKPIVIYNYMPIQSWPKYYDEPFVDGGIYKHTDGTTINCLPFLNIPIIKRIFMGKSLYKEIKKWAKTKDNRTKVIIVYSLIPEFLRAVKIAKKINRDIIVFSIVADLPEYTVLDSHISFSTKIYLNWMKTETNKLLSFVDGFALLTAQMKEKLRLTQKCIVMEGICSEGIKASPQITKTILYAGTLHKRFGVMNLIQAMPLVKDKAYKLVVCGMGDCENEIKKIANNDKNVVFKGQVKRNEILDLLSSCSIVVNPRNCSEDYTKYSFPSKNLEALSSGKPFIAYKLQGIPEEYNDLIIYPRGKTVDELADTINDVIDNYDYYLARAHKAKCHILHTKNKKQQTLRIIEAIKDISNAKKGVNS